MMVRALVIGCFGLVCLVQACAEDRSIGPETPPSIAVSVLMDSETRTLHTSLVDQVRISLWQDDLMVESKTGQSGDSVTFNNPDPGTYTVVVEGLVDTETDFFGIKTNVAAAAGQNTVVAISNYASFRPQLNEFSSPTPDVQIDISFGLVATAASYVVEWGYGQLYDHNFPTTGASAYIIVDSAGTYNVRVRANNQWVPSGRASDSQSIEIQADTSGDVPAEALNLGSGTGAGGTYDSLNILPANDVDWFTLDLVPGDRLTAGVHSSSLGDPSHLNPTIALYLDPSGSPIAEDGSAGEVQINSFGIATAGTYFLRVGSQASAPVAARGTAELGAASALQPQVMGEVGRYELVIQVVRSLASPNTSTINSSPTVIAANGTSTSVITVQLKDASGNNLTDGGDDVELSTTAGSLSAVADNENGTYDATLTASTTTESATITGTLNSVALLDDATVAFTRRQLPDAALSTISASPLSIPADGSSTSTLTVQLKDIGGNNLTAGADQVELETSSGALSSVTDNENGTYTALLTASTVAGDAMISGTVNGVSMTDQATVTFSLGVADATTSMIAAVPTIIEADGSSTSTIILQLKDTNGNNLVTGGDIVELSTTAGSLSSVIDNHNGTYTATLTSSTTAENATVTGTVNAVSMSDNATVVFRAGLVPDANTSTISLSPTSVPADGSSISTITVQLKDAAGNNLTTGEDQVGLSTTAGTLSSVTDNGNGTYTATITASTVAGIVTINGFVNGVTMSEQATVTFSVGAADATTSLITAVPTSISADRSSTSTITVQLKDANGNNLIAGGDQVELSATAGALSSVTDNENGTYTSILTSSLTVGMVTINGTLNGSTLDDFATVDFIPIGIPLTDQETIFNFDLTGQAVAPPFDHIAWTVTFSVEDPISGTDVLITGIYGEHDGAQWVQTRNDTEWIINDGGRVYGPWTTANAIFNPLLDGIFSYGLTMTSGTTFVLEFTVCGTRQDPWGEACMTIP